MYRLTIILLLIGGGFAQAQPIRELSGHLAPVYAVAFSPDGRRLATGSFDRHIKVWDAATGQLKRTLTGHPVKVVALAWSPDGERLASADVAGEVRLWDLQRKTFRRLKGHEGCVYAVAFSPDSRRLVTCGHDRKVRVWEVGQASPVLTLGPHSGPLYAVAANSQRLAVGGLDGTIHLYDLATGAAGGELSGHQDAVYSLTFTPGGGLVSGSGDRSIRVWDLATGKQRAQLAGHREAVYQVGCTAESHRLVSAGTDGLMVVWDADSGQALQSHRFPGKALCAAVAADGARIAVGTRQAACYLVDLPQHWR